MTSIHILSALTARERVIDVDVFGRETISSSGARSTARSLQSFLAIIGPKWLEGLATPRQPPAWRTIMIGRTEIETSRSDGNQSSSGLVGGATLPSRHASPKTGSRLPKKQKTDVVGTKTSPPKWRAISSDIGDDSLADRDHDSLAAACWSRRPCSWISSLSIWLLIVLILGYRRTACIDGRRLKKQRSAKWRSDPGNVAIGVCNRRRLPLTSNGGCGFIADATK